MHEILYNTQKNRLAQYNGGLKRLQAVFELVQEGSRVADIGTDHGLLAIALHLSGRCPTVIGVDRCESPLQVARANVKHYLQTEHNLSWKCRSNIRAGVNLARSLGHTLDLRLGNGTDSLRPFEVDTLTIAGMGASSIIDILSESFSKQYLKGAVIQPVNSKLPEMAKMREWLHLNDWSIKTETVVTSAQRQYITLQCSLQEFQDLEKKKPVQSLEQKLLGQTLSTLKTHNCAYQQELYKYLKNELHWQKYIATQKANISNQEKSDATHVISILEDACNHLKIM